MSNSRNIYLFTVIRIHNCVINRNVVKNLFVLDHLMWYPISYMWTNPSASIDQGSGRSILRTEIWCILIQQIRNPWLFCSIIALHNFKALSIVRTWAICDFIEFDFIKTNWKKSDKMSLLEGNTMSKAFKIFQ